MKLKVKRVDGEMRGILPTKGSKKAAGLDIYTYEERTLRPGQTHMFSTGIIFVIPKGHEGQVRSRSGLAAKHSVHVLNSPGTIDEDYTGEAKIILHNASDKPYKVNAGDRIAQIIIKPVVSVDAPMMWAEEIKTTERGDGGFGSTGA